MSHECEAGNMGSGVTSHFLALLTRPRMVEIFGDALVNLECFGVPCIVVRIFLLVWAAWTEKTEVLKRRRYQVGCWWY